MLVERIPRECFTPSFELSSCRLPKFRLFNLVVGVLIRAQIWFRLTSDAWQLQVKSVAKHMTSVAVVSEEIHPAIKFLPSCYPHSSSLPYIL